MGWISEFIVRTFDYRRMYSQKSFFALSQILAILSGTWMVGAGMYQAFSSNMLALSMNQINNLAQMQPINNTMVSNEMINITHIVSNSAAHSMNFSFTLFMTGIGLGCAAVLIWCIGSMFKKT